MHVHVYTSGILPGLFVLEMVWQRVDPRLPNLHPIGKTQEVYATPLYIIIVASI